MAAFYSFLSRYAGFVFLSSAVALAVVPGAVQAQRAATGYVVTAAGDTIRGVVSQKAAEARAQQVRLTPANGPTTTYAAAELRSYSATRQDLLLSKSVGPKAQFVKPLVLGYASLYTGVNPAGDLRFYLQAPDSTGLQELTPGQVQLQLHRTLGGCPSLHFGDDEAMRRYPHTARGLTRAVLEYNSCRRPGQPSRQPRVTSGWRASYGLKAGPNVTGLFFSYYQGLYYSQIFDDFHLKSTRPGLGFQAGPYANIAFRNHASVQVELQYSIVRASSPVRGVYTGTTLYTATEEGTYRLTQLYLPVLARYTFGTGQCRPFINVGPSFAAGLSHSTVLTYRRSDRPGTETLPVYLPGSSTLGIAAGLGLVWARSTGALLALEARHDEGIIGFGTSLYTRVRTVRLDLSLGF
ncbi:PorT family protein [Hymenobacter busanensis]|uniref:PorT family protein n=1 Tax=Hymenobacter busanensis TaxID=2607656 RepID=A0A7L4ZSR6_9BACT|nr:porin family protein [Hymenobacter busanensis]KAA9327140.1 PorT family protein [Hymenobacter busanensis]QHJ05805.1 outer membrane beta-barrel protein [Hymenobacter busanensis]